MYPALDHWQCAHRKVDGAACECVLHLLGRQVLDVQLQVRGLLQQERGKLWQEHELTDIRHVKPEGAGRGARIELSALPQ